VLEAGDEEMPLVVCLHGFPDHPMSFEWLMGSLAEAGYHAVAPWMRGYSPSTTEGPFDVGRLVADVVELADALAPGARLALIGHDFGAVVTYAAASQLGDRLACAVTMAVPHPHAFARNLRSAPGQLLRSRYMALFQLPGISERKIWKSDFEYIDTLWHRWSPNYQLPEPHRARLKSCLAASMPAPLRYYRDLLSLRTLRVALRSKEALSQPFLYLHGEDDGCIHPTMAAGMEDLFRGPFSSEIVADAGHFLHIEAAPRVTNRVLGWLRQHWPPEA